MVGSRTEESTGMETDHSLADWGIRLVEAFWSSASGLSRRKATVDQTEVDSGKTTSDSKRLRWPSTLTRVWHLFSCQQGLDQAVSKVGTDRSETPPT